MEWLADFHFLRPYWLLALIIPVAWGIYLFKNERVQSSWANVCDEHLLNYLLIKGENSQRRVSYVLAVLIALATVISLAGPSWIKKKNPALSVDNPVMIMVNLAVEMTDRDVSPNRLERAKYIVKDILQTFKSTETGLMVYSGEPFVISPLTEDEQLIDNLLPTLNVNLMPADGDRLDKAIDLAVSRMQNSGYENGNLVVLTSDVGSHFDKAMESAENASRQGFDVNVIKVSAEDNDKLRMVAEKGAGVYLNYNQSYGALSNKINDIYAKKIHESDNMQTVWLDMGYYVFWLPALLLLYYFRKGILLAVLLVVICGKAEAGLFLNENQEALRYFKQQQYDKAAQLFKSPQWRGAAAYKSGDYKRALKEFSQGADTTALYNQGNALAKSGKIDEAIKMYEEVLKQDPDFADAAYNLEYLKKYKQQQQQQQQKQDKSKDKQQQQSGDKEQGKDKQNQQNEAQNKQDNSAEKQAQKEEQNKQEQQKSQSSSEQDNSQGEEKKQQQEAKPEPDSENQQQSDTENSQDEQKQDANNKQNENRDGSEEQTDADETQKNDGGNASESSENTQETDKSQGNGGSYTDKQESGEGQEQDGTAEAQFGEEDENSEQKAQGLQTQAGDQDEETKREKIRARMQRFRDIPEDEGGLIRALIAKEYRLRTTTERQP